MMVSVLPREPVMAMPWSGTTPRFMLVRSTEAPDPVWSKSNPAFWASTGRAQHEIKIPRIVNWRRRFTEHTPSRKFMPLEIRNDPEAASLLRDCEKGGHNYSHEEV